MVRPDAADVTPALAAAVRAVFSEMRVPVATYRLQFNSGFTLRDGEALLPYLIDLGITDCYASPLLRARAESAHGYDVANHSEVSPAIGGEKAFNSFAARLREAGMGLILDVVPNHMGIGDEANAWWVDVLENGPSSPYAPYFDIDWRPARRELENKVLLAILEDQYGKVLEAGKLRLSYECGAFFILYYNTRLPVEPTSYATILGETLPRLLEQAGENDDTLELQSILTALSYLPPYTEQSPERVTERVREKEMIKRRVAALHDRSRAFQEALAHTIEAFNGRVGEPASFDLLDSLLAKQVYRPAFWRVAAEEINYRRFFDINDLAAIRVELPEVFEETHRLILRFLAEGKATGLRIDHPDGLRDPSAYFLALQENYVLRKVALRLGLDMPDNGDAPWVRAAKRLIHAEMETRGLALYVVAEKILSEGEPLPGNWAINGTTGYDFLNAVNGILVDSNNRRAFDRIYGQFTGVHTNFRNLANSTRKMIMLVSLASEINALSHQLERLAEGNRRYRDFTLNTLTFAIREVVAALPVYRTYLTGTSDGALADSERYISQAVREAKRRNPRTAEAIFDFIADTLLLRNIGDFPEEVRPRLVDFVLKFQQLTGPVMAKGLEDTAFYIYNRLVSLNEVGGYPQQFGISVDEFHRRNAERLQCWPHSMLATATHDTKRGEDVRARIDVLSEIPDEWRAALSRWSRLNAPKKSMVDGEPAPDRNDEYLLYQTLLGVWPFGNLDARAHDSVRERVVEYMTKATKEAKVHTSWINPNEDYDEAVAQFVRRCLSRQGRNAFLRDFLGLQRRVAYFGVYNSLSQVLLKLASPGVPDTYQGTELWDLSLVDPDNRRPVDFEIRRKYLDSLRRRAAELGDDLVPLAEELLANPGDGRIKMYVIYRVLNYRRDHAPLFAEGEYLPLFAAGELANHVCAFARRRNGEEVIAVAPRLIVGLTQGTEQRPVGEDVWGDTVLQLPDAVAGTEYRNVLTGETMRAIGENGQASLPMATVLAHFPVALLERL